MKKFFVFALLIIMVLCMTACGGDTQEVDPNLVITRSTDQDTADTAESDESSNSSEQVSSSDSKSTDSAETVFAFKTNGVNIIPGTPFNADDLPEASSIYTVPSCAIEGTDNVYNYTTFEVTAYDEGDGEFVYSVYLLDPNVTTAEGLSLGDNISRAIELYGENYTQDGSAYVYARSSTMLYLIVQNDSIIGIEYRLDVK